MLSGSRFTGPQHHIHLCSSLFENTRLKMCNKEEGIRLTSRYTHKQISKDMIKFIKVYRFIQSSSVFQRYEIEVSTDGRGDRVDCISNTD